MIHKCMDCNYFDTSDYWLDKFWAERRGAGFVALKITMPLAGLSDDVAFNGGRLRDDLDSDIWEAVGPYEP